MPRFSSRDLFAALDGQVFRTQRDLQTAVLELYNRHLADFPPDYGYVELVEWGISNGWVIPDEGGGVRIQVHPEPIAA